LWQANPDVWPRHAPNLFPVVGTCLKNELLVDGKAYSIGRHGFARDMVFRRVESTPVHAKFSLHYNEETLKSFPYKFEFQILYDLMDNKLRVSYKVINLDAGTIYFSLGAHPAFNVPFSGGENYEDYILEFEKPEQLSTHELDEGGFFSGSARPINLNGSTLPVSRKLFEKDALVFKNLASRKVCLKNNNGDKSICVSFPHFNYLGIWAKPGADFLCIEPWLGCADTSGKAVDIRQKDGIQQAEHGHVFETDYCIEIGA
jgi:galactose mutarotase-like enzyme